MFGRLEKSGSLEDSDEDVGSRGNRGAASSQHFEEEDATKRPEVRAAIDRRAARCSGSCRPVPTIAPCSVKIVDAAPARTAGVDLGESKVSTCATVARNLDVGRLEVAMHDAALVRRFERGGNLRAEPQRVGDRKRPVADQIGKRLAAHQLHDQAAPVAELGELVKRGDIRVVERREDPGFAAKPGQAVRVVTKAGVDELDGDVAIERGVAGPVPRPCRRRQAALIAEAHPGLAPLEE